MDEDADTGLPQSIEAAWGRSTRPSKGRKPALSLSRIVKAGIAVAATDGMAAVSMSRVAALLGTAPMSLYRYVSAKDELVALMVDEALGPPPELPAPGDDWRSGLTRWSWALRAGWQQHRWALDAPVSGPPVTPNHVGWMERALRCLRDTGLTEAEKLSVLMLVSGYVRAATATGAQLDIAMRSPSAAQVMTGYKQVLTRLIDPEQFPAITAVIDSGVFDGDEPDDPDEDFTFGLERVLDGIESLVTQRRDRGSPGQ